MRFRVWIVSLAASWMLVSCSDALEFSVIEDEIESANSSKTCSPECEYGKTCKDGVCVIADDGACTDNAMRCNGRQPQICEHLAWKDAGSACSGNTVCRQGKCSLDGTICMMNGVYTCLNAYSDGPGYVYECSNTLWKELESCAGSSSCLDTGNQLANENLCGSCLNHTYQCQSEGESVSLRECVNGVWSTKGKCKGPCDESNGCEVN